MRLLSFKYVVGNINTKNILMKSLENNTLPKFCIFAGPPGTGKSTCAEISAMRLVCSHPNGAEPCGECENCKTSKKVIEGEGKSVFFKKINVANLSKDEMKNIITEVFKTETGNNKTVYVWEEAHVLDSVSQTALLEEIDRIPENVYIIVCTTKPNNLLPELRSRAIMYRFNNLTPKESNLLIDMECRRLNMNLNKDIKRTIQVSSKGSPRVITLNLDYIKKNHEFMDEENLAKFLGEVSTVDLRNLLKSYSDITESLIQLKRLTEEYNVFDIVRSLKNYVMECCFLSKGVSYKDTELDAMDKSFATTLGIGVWMKIYSELDQLPANPNLSDLQYRLIRVITIITKTMKSKMPDEIQTVSQGERNRITAETRQEVVKENNSSSNLLSSNSFKDFFNENVHKE